MTSYIPDYCIRHPGRGGPIAEAWPAHIQPRADSSGVELTKKGEAYAEAALAEAGGVFFLTLDRDRASIATTIERLINMLDDMEGDSDLEPYLAGGDGANDDREADHSGGTSDDEATMGWGMGSQARLEAALHDECEDVSEDEGADIQSQPHDDDYACGDDNEPSSGWTEDIDQSRMGGYQGGTQHEEMEPDLGFAGLATGWREGEGNDDREQNNGSDDEREKSDGDEGDYSQNEDDSPIDLLNVLGSTPATRVPPMVEKARRLKSGIIVRETVPTPIPHDAIPMLKASDFARLPWA